MTPADITGRFLAAQAIAGEAGRLARRFLAEPDRLQVELKGPQDFVSAADRAVERLVARRLASAFPSDAVLGEEIHVDGAARAGDALWVVDPIDGTANFVQGRPDWCVSIGLLWKGRPTIGVVHHPPADELYAAAAGHGATCNGSAIRVSDRRSLVGAMIGLDYSSRTPPAAHSAQIEAVLACGGEYRRNGSTALSLAHVASGRLDGFVELHLYAWDVVAGIVLIREAGGWTSDFLARDGLRRGNPLVATAPGIRDELLTLLNLED